MGRAKIKILESVLRKLYLKQKLNPQEIAGKLNCNFETVRNRLKEYKIPLRDPSVARMRYKKNDYNGELKRKAYMIGFRMGDLNIYSPGKTSQTVVARCHTTQREQIYVIRTLFEKYGKVTVSSNRGHLHANCFLNNSFSFLLPKNNSAWKWVKEDYHWSKHFIAGYVDAEGNFILNQGRARFKLDSYDVSILKWMSRWLTQNGIHNKFRRIYKKGDVWNGKSPLNEDLWRLNINDKSSLIMFIGIMLPIFLHKIRISDAKKCLANIFKRNEKRKY